MNWVYIRGGREKRDIQFCFDPLLVLCLCKDGVALCFCACGHEFPAFVVIDDGGDL